MENQIKINSIPSPTYNWLKMNDAEVRVPSVLADGDPVLTRSRDIDTGVDSYSGIADIAGGMGFYFDNYLKDSGVRVLKLHVPSGVRAALPVIMDVPLKNNEASLIEVEAEEGAALTIAMHLRAETGEDGIAMVQTKLRIREKAEVKLVQTFISGEVTLLNDVGAAVSEEGSFCQLQLFLSGQQIYMGSRTALLGKKSSLKTDIGYLLKDEERLDMNYIVDHMGKKTCSNIDAKGVLRDHAFKLFRGTIDLRRGAAGAVGTELEDVLLMDDEVINQTIPVILCDEEDVEGNHGATIGRIDEELMFYLQSRGMEEKAIYEMMAEARIAEIVGRIEDPVIRRETGALAGISQGEDA